MTDRQPPLQPVIRQHRHSYTHTGNGRWKCPTCDVGIRKADCPYNRALDSAAPQPADNAQAGEQS